MAALALGPSPARRDAWRGRGCCAGGPSGACRTPQSTPQTTSKTEEEK
ncbi:hypothetical protein ABZ891_09635 [Streptomyces sp. NPDC047023]